MGLFMLASMYLLEKCLGDPIKRSLRDPINLAVDHCSTLVATMFFPGGHSSPDETAAGVHSSPDESIYTDREPSPESPCNCEKGGTAHKYSGFYWSPLYGGAGGMFFNDGTYSGIRRITLTFNIQTLTSVQLDYGIEDISVRDRKFPGVRHGGARGAKIVYDLNYPEEIITKISGF